MPLAFKARQLFNKNTEGKETASLQSFKHD